MTEIMAKNYMLLDSYLLNLQTTGKSPNTIRSYKDGIVQFLDSIGDRDFTSISYADAEDFQNSLFFNEKSTATIQLRKASLSSFSKYVKKRLGRETFFDNQFSLLDAMPVTNKKEKVIWNQDKLFNLISICEEKGDFELATLLALAVFSGRRRMELTRFKVSDFQDSNLCCNGMFYKSSKIQTKGRAGKPMECYVLSKFKPYLENWLKVRKTDSIWLFPKENNPNEHIDDMRMGFLAEKVKSITGFGDFHWHLIRHTFVTLLMDSNIDKEIVTKLIGWSSSNMINIYYDKSREDQIEQYFTNTQKVV